MRSDSSIVILLRPANDRSSPRWANRLEKHLKKHKAFIAIALQMKLKTSM